MERVAQGTSRRATRSSAVGSRAAVPSLSTNIALVPSSFPAPVFSLAFPG